MINSFKPIDYENRNRIVNHLNETLFVEAGAGTGKTTALVQRIVSLVKAGNEMKKIAAITFTEAAAGELRNRIRQELEKEVIKTGNTLCVKAASDLDGASIQTLHSFAGALLQERPLEAGLPPGFNVVENIGAEINFEERWQKWLDVEMNAEETARPFIKGMRLGLRLDNLKDIAKAFHENYDLLPTRFTQEMAPSVNFVSKFVETVSEFQSLLQCAHNGQDDPLVEHCQRLIEFAGRIEVPGPESEAALLILSRVGKISFTAGRQSDWDCVPDTRLNACKLLKDELKQLHEIVAEGLEQTRRDVLIPLLEKLREFVRVYAAERRRDGKAEFHDLLIWARDLLKNDISARHYFQRKFSHILVDEFQDTDPIQAEIAFFLAEKANDDKESELDWKMIKLEPGKLFVVGDPKQSIYRFRRADITIVKEVKELITSNASPTNYVPLMQNFRSQRTIIEWINAVFKECMAENDTGTQACYILLEPRWEPPQTDPPLGVHFIGGPMEGRAADVRRLEADEVARSISTMKSSQWQVRDMDSLKLRPVKYQDICVLMPTRTGLQIFERALDTNGIPYRVESQSMLLGTQDVKELLSCLRAIDTPSDMIALVAALRSSAFSITDVELLEFVENGGNLDYTNPGTAKGAVRDALEILAAYHEKHIWFSPAEIIESFVRERCMEEVCFGRARPRERLRRLQFVIEKARVFSEVEESSLRGFLDWIERLAYGNARMVEVPVPETDEDAIRIMTIHAAKGREFPVTVLMGIGFGSNTQSETVLFDCKKNAVEISIGPANGPKFVTSGYDEANAREKLAGDAEYIRLMYVAATRAKDHLVISLYRVAKKTDSSFANTIERTCIKTPEIWHRLEFNQNGQSLEEPNAAKIDYLLDTEEDRIKWLEERETLIKRASRLVSLAATTIARINKDEAEGELPYRKGRGGTNLGRAVHSVLQTIDLTTDDKLEETAAAQAANEGIPERTDDVVKLVRNALNSEAVKRAVASGRYYREVFVSAPIDKCSVDGFIDLLFEEDNQFVIVDYKTDAIEEVPSDSKKDQYLIQAGIYALAVSRITGRPVKDIILLFLKVPKELTFKASGDLISLAEKTIQTSLLTT